MKKISIVAIASLLLLLFVFAVKNNKVSLTNFQTDIADNMGGEAPSEPYSLSIESLRQGDYPGSDLVIEETLSPGSNYSRYIVSYKSEGLKIYALLTIPNLDSIASLQNDGKGFPAIVFNHGFIPPKEYRTDERYVAYQDAFARNGYVTFKSDYRGHGESEGNPSGAYGSNGYTIDVLNALASLKRLGESGKGEVSGGNESLALNALPFPLVNPDRVGMWGHSLGGFITLRAMVVNKDLPAGRQDIKAGVIWAGVVASYDDLINNWRRPIPSSVPTGARRWRQALIDEFGSPEENPEFWASLSANTFLSDISGPIQLHHGTADESVPIKFSKKLEKQLREAGKTVELFEYQGDDHNISSNFNTAAQRSVEFFNKYLK